MVGSALAGRPAVAAYRICRSHPREQLDLCDQAKASIAAARQPDIVIIAAAKVGGIHANSSLPGGVYLQNFAIAGQSVRAAARAAMCRAYCSKSAEDSGKTPTVPLAEERRPQTLSTTNNIAEGSGSFSQAELAQFLNSRPPLRPVETANILMLLARAQFLPETSEPLLEELDEICRMITAFRKSIL